VQADGATAKFSVDHPDEAAGILALMRAIGITDLDLYDGLMGHLVNASWRQNALSQSGTNFMLSVVRGIEPRDQIEAMLAAQMAAVHAASMTFARRLAHVENIPQQDSAERAFNKLTRTFAAQMSALKEYRSEGRAEDDGPARPCRRGQPGDRRQRQRAHRGGGRNRVVRRQTRSCAPTCEAV
jgi:hypothetical protein